MPTDVLLKQDALGNYGLELDEDGDIQNGDFFDSSLIYSLFGERRALEYEMPVAEFRRGWIGNEGQLYENGSKIWLYEQARLTKTNLNGLASEATIGTQWLVDDEFAQSVSSTAVRNNLGVGLIVDIKRKNSKITRFFQLWENTGVSNAT